VQGVSIRSHRSSVLNSLTVRSKKNVSYVVSFIFSSAQGCQIESVSIRFSIEKLQKPFDLIQYQFNPKTDSIWCKTASAFMRENRPSEKW
jgi:hypothetical protein